MLQRVLAGLLVVGMSAPHWAAEPAAPVLIDAAGKESTLKAWRFTSGTRPLSWLAKDGKAPEALMFRQANSTLFKEGVVTLIPIERLESLSYDAEKQTVQAKVAGLDKPLEGSIRYREINQLTIVAEIDRGGEGIVEVTYRGGALKGGIRGLRFNGAKAADPPAGSPTYITIVDGKQKLGSEPVTQLKALYRIDKDREELSTTLMFKKTYKLDMAQIQKMKVHENLQTKSIECDVTLRDGTEQTLTLLSAATINGKSAALEGLLGIVPAGYKLFPMHTIGELSPDDPTKLPPPKPKADPR